MTKRIYGPKYAKWTSNELRHAIVTRTGHRKWATGKRRPVWIKHLRQLDSNRKFDLLKLPKELRLIVYELILQPETYRVLQANRLALLQVSRQVNEEAEAIWYPQRVFRWEFSGAVGHYSELRLCPQLLTRHSPDIKGTFLLPEFAKTITFPPCLPKIQKLEIKVCLWGQYPEGGGHMVPSDAVGYRCCNWYLYLLVNQLLESKDLRSLRVAYMGSLRHPDDILRDTLFPLALLPPLRYRGLELRLCGLPATVEIYLEAHLNNEACRRDTLKLYFDLLEQAYELSRKGKAAAGYKMLRKGVANVKAGLRGVTFIDDENERMIVEAVSTLKREIGVANALRTLEPTVAAKRLKAARR